MNAKYTVVLKTLLDDDFAKSQIEKALSTYPIYKQTTESEFHPAYIPTREELNKKILNAYKYREIAFETPARFYDELEIAMCEIMPYYNQLMHSADVISGIDDIFGNIDITERYEEIREGESKSQTVQDTHSNSSSSSDGESTSSQDSDSHTINNGSSDTESLDKKIVSTTPGDDISITGKNMNNVNYADSVEWNHNKTDSNQKSQSQTNNSNITKEQNYNQMRSDGSAQSSGTNEASDTVKTTHIDHRKGNQGVNTYAHDMLEFRELFLNIEQQIINNERISELFMRVF